MSKSKDVLIRFHTDYTREKAAFERLAQLQKQTHLSQSQIVISALNAYQPEGQEQNELMLHRVTECVMEANRKTLPAIIADGLSEFPVSTVITKPEAIPTADAAKTFSPTVSEPASSDVSQQDYVGVNWDFVGG